MKISKKGHRFKIEYPRYAAFVHLRARSGFNAYADLPRQWKWYRQCDKWCLDCHKRGWNLQGEIQQFHTPFLTMGFDLMHPISDPRMWTAPCSGGPVQEFLLIVLVFSVPLLVSRRCSSALWFFLLFAKLLPGADLNWVPCQWRPPTGRFPSNADLFVCFVLRAWQLFCCSLCEDSVY